MKSRLYLGVLMVGLLGLGDVHGQGPGNLPALPGGSVIGPGSSGPPVIANNSSGGNNLAPTPDAPLPGGPGPGMAAGPAGPPPGGYPFSDYLTYRRYGACCGPVGSHGPIAGEVYFRPGISIPLGGSLLGRTMDPGLMLQGGTRALFFTPSQDFAWTIDVGINTVWYDAGKDLTVELVGISQVVRNPITGQALTDADGLPIVNFINVPVIPSSLNQTYVHLSLGNEVYLLGTGNTFDGEPKWRVGYDVGGRWGSAKLIAPKVLRETERDTFKHRTDVIGGWFLALHTDFEMPFKGFMIVTGLRTEIGYMWQDLLQPRNDTDLATANILFNCGLRF